jgi:hypothetical protein
MDFGKAEKYELFKAQDQENGYFDVTFDIDGKLIYANKLMLGPISTTFKSVFAERLKENKNNEPIKIEKYSYENFNNFLTFLYSGKLTLNNENLYPIAALSEYYNVKELQQRVNEYLKIFPPRKTIEYYNNLSQYPTFKATLLNIFKEWFPLFLDYADNFRDAKKETMKAIVCLERPFKYEQKFFEMVYKWAENLASIKQQQQSDENIDKFNFNEIIKNELADLLPFIHFNAMDKEFVKNFIGNQLLYEADR